MKNLLFVGSGVTTPAQWVYRDDLSKSQTAWTDGSAIYTLAWGNSKYVAIGTNYIDGSLKCATSSDGVTWAPNTGLSTLGFLPFSNFRNLVWTGSLFVAVGRADSSAPDQPAICATSPDGISWTRRTNIESSSYVGGNYRIVDALVWTGSKLIMGMGNYIFDSTNGGSSWSQRADLTSVAGWSGLDINSIIWDGTKLVAISAFDVVASTDGNVGAAWTFKAGFQPVWDGTFNAGLSICYSGSRYVITGSQGAVLTSTNLTSWSYTNVSSNKQIQDINWNGSRFLLGGYEGLIATSPDGLSWTIQTSLPNTAWGSNSVSAITWNGSQYLIGGDRGCIANSTTGSSWTYQDALAASLTAWGSDTGFGLAINGSSLVLAVGASSSIATTTDGITWTNQLGLLNTTWGNYNDVYGTIWNGTKFVVCGANGVATSTDGVTWTHQTSLLSTTWGGTVAYCIARDSAGNCFIGGDYGRIATSSDGVTWTYRGQLSTTAWGSNTVSTACTSSANKFLVGGVGGRVATSTDAITWTYQAGLASTAFGATDVYSSAWGASKFVVGGVGGKIATSPDGITWTNQTGLSSTGWGTADVMVITWNGSKFLAGGYNGKIAWSNDGITWTYDPTLSSTYWGNGDNSGVGAAVWTGSKFIVIGASAKAATYS